MHDIYEIIKGHPRNRGIYSLGVAQRNPVFLDLNEFFKSRVTLRWTQATIKGFSSNQSRQTTCLINRMARIQF